MKTKRVLEGYETLNGRWQLRKVIESDIPGEAGRAWDLYCRLDFERGSALVWHERFPTKRAALQYAAELDTKIAAAVEQMCS